LKEAAARLGFYPIMTKNIEDATVVIGLKRHLKQNIKLRKLAQIQGKISYPINSVSLLQLTKILRNVL